MMIKQTLIIIICWATVFSCKKQVVVPDSMPCDLSTSTITLQEAFDFEIDFSSNFSQSTRWASEKATIELVEGSGKLTANSEKTKQALEAWKLYKNQMPYNKSWEFSAEVTVPTYWNSNGGKKAQVGIGLFAGMPVESGQSSKVYECNFAAINGKERFVQAQLVANRLGADPIDVQRTVLENAIETVVLKIQFCSTYHSLSLFVDDKQVGKSKAIDENGGDNWGLTADGMIDIGIMGFAEKTTITANSPTIDNLKIKIF